MTAAQRTSLPEVFELFTHDGLDVHYVSTPLFDSVQPPLSELLDDIDISTVEFNVAADDALALFDQEPAVDETAEVLDEQWAAWKAWVLCLSLGAVLGFILWAAVVAA